MLMTRWSSRALHQGEQFIRDGIIDFNKWASAGRKILLLLKEAYDCDDLCSTIRDEWQGPRYNIWWTASYWLYALQNCSGNSFKSFPSSETEYEECKRHLLSAAVINVKKSGGTSSSNDDDLSKYVKEDGEVICEQIELINPDIILCGYTYGFFKEIVKETPASVGKAGYLYRVNGRTIIDWWHPAKKYPNEIWYYALCAALIDAKGFS